MPPGDMVVAFWAGSLRAAALSGGRADVTLPRLLLPAPYGTGTAERWELLSAVGESLCGPPSAAQLALLDHLSPPHSPAPAIL
jgi:hypothetical protein